MPCRQAEAGLTEAAYKFAPRKRFQFCRGLAIGQHGLVLLGIPRWVGGAEPVPPGGTGAGMSLALWVRRYFSTENVNTVRDVYVFPGLKIVDGKLGWLGESGKCCVSRQKPNRRLYRWPPLPVSVPSKKFPV